MPTIGGTLNGHERNTRSRREGHGPGASFHLPVGLRPFPTPYSRAFSLNRLPRKPDDRFQALQLGVVIRMQTLRSKHVPPLVCLPPVVTQVLQALNSSRVLSAMSRLTGIEDLRADAQYHGGGMHRSLPGGFLDIHADFNKLGRLDRRLNLLVYLNRDLRDDWGGHLELWNRDMTQCVQSYEPSFNRAVVFSTTSWSYHGHPRRIECPPGESRKSLALYYYTEGRPKQNSVPRIARFTRRRHHEKCGECRESGRQPFVVVMRQSADRQQLSSDVVERPDGS